MAITGPNEGRLPCERFPLGTQMAPLQAEAPPRANAGRQRAPAALRGTSVWNKVIHRLRTGYTYVTHRLYTALRWPHMTVPQVFHTG